MDVTVGKQLITYIVECGQFISWLWMYGARSERSECKNKPKVGLELEFVVPYASWLPLHHQLDVTKSEKDPYGRLPGQKYCLLLFSVSALSLIHIISQNRSTMPRHAGMYTFDTSSRHILVPCYACFGPVLDTSYEPKMCISVALSLSGYLKRHIGQPGEKKKTLLLYCLQ